MMPAEQVMTASAGVAATEALAASAEAFAVGGLDPDRPYC
jgi:hypothetical protein